MVRESAKKAVQATVCAGGGGEVRSACAPGKLVVVNLTNLLVTASEANGVFSVLVEHLRALLTRYGVIGEKGWARVQNTCNNTTQNAHSKD